MFLPKAPGDNLFPRLFRLLQAVHSFARVTFLRLQSQQNDIFTSHSLSLSDLLLLSLHLFVLLSFLPVFLIRTL